MKINRAIIIGGGSSIRENLWDIPIDKIPVWKALKTEFTIGTNFIFHYFNPTVLMYSDYQFYYSQKKYLDSFPLVLGSKAGYYNKKDSLPIGNNVILLKEAETKRYLKYNDREEGLHPYYWGDDSWIKGWYTSQLVGIKALSLALALHVDEIYLLGMDATDINGHTHFYDDTDVGHYIWDKIEHCGVGKNDKNKFNTGNYNNIDELNNYWYKPFENITRSKIYNVSLNSKIDTFTKISYEDFYKRLNVNKNIVNNNDIVQLLKNKLQDDIK